MSWVATFEASVNSASDRASSIREFTSCLFVRFVEGISGAIGRWFPASTYSSVISASGVAVTAVWMASSGKGTNVHSSVHGIDVLEVSWTTLNGSFSIMVDIDGGIHIVVILISIYGHTVLVLLLNWITGTSIGSLLSQFGLGDSFRNLLCISLTSIIGASRVHAIHHVIVVLGRIEELLSGHHHLLLMVLASIWCFSLVHQVE